MATAVAEDRPILTIDTPANIRTLHNNGDGALLTLRANNIQVRADWSVTPTVLFTIYADGKLHFIGNINQTVNVDVNVMVKDKFSDLNNDYNDLMAHAVINMTLIPEKNIFVLGGSAGFDGSYNDVWKSSDGKNWSKANNLWTKLSSHQAVVHRGTIYVLGGNNDGSNINDVWSSTDGDTWIMLGTAVWSPRNNHQAVVHGGTIYVLGGNDGTQLTNDVWASTDGISWSAITLSANWSGRQLHQAVSYQGRLYVMGGNPGGLSQNNDVWSSADGSVWSLETDANNGAEWPARYSYQAVVHQGTIYVLGGRASGNTNDVWSSVNGQTWLKVTTEGAKWEERWQHQAVSYNNRIYVLGGNTGTYQNDVWSSVDGSEWSLEAAGVWPKRGNFQAIVFP